jgi:hypothetical protein
MNFVSKLSDADGELQETAHWLATAEACGYLSANQLRALQGCLKSIGKKLGAMMAKPETFIPRGVVARPLPSTLPPRAPGVRPPTSDLPRPASGLSRPPA